MKHRKTLLMLCIFGIVLSWFLPLLIMGIHDAHAIATVHEFSTYRLIDQQQVEAFKAEYAMPDYSVEQRVRAVGGLHIYMRILTFILSALFIAIGVLVWCSKPSNVNATIDD